MKRFTCIILLVLSIMFVMTIGLHKEKQTYDNRTEKLGKTSAIVSAKETEKDSMKREVCKVEKIQEDSFVLKNMTNDLYYIDNSFLGDFKVGDNVLLLYLSRTPLEIEGYTCIVHAIYPADNRVLFPAQ